MKYEFSVESKHVQKVVFHRLSDDIFCVTLITRDAASAEIVRG